MTIDSIITEWTYRLPKGYPTTDSDYNILRNVLSEMTNLSENDLDRIVNQAKGLQEQSGDEEPTTSRFSELNVSPTLIDQIQQTYDSLPDNKKQAFDTHYRHHSIESFVSQGYFPFKDFYWITDQSKAAGGMGRGEIQTLLAVKDSKSGGTSQHDIVLSDGEWEVKEVGKVGAKAKTFRPAAIGMTQQGDLLSKIQDFFNDIVIPFSQMADPYETLKDVVDDHSWERLTDFIAILNQTFVPLIPNVTAGREISYKTGWQSMFNAFKKMHDIFWKTNFDTDIQDTRLSIKSNDKQSSYWITDDDYDKIEKNSGSDDSVDIHIGNSVENENSNSVIWFNRIKRSTYIATPDSIILELNQIKNKFFADILGLIVYDTQQPGRPTITPANEWAIVSVSQGMWVFGLKITYDNNYTFIHLQS